MKNNTRKLKPAIIAMAIAAAYPTTSVWADDDLESIISPNEREVSVTIQNTGGDNLRFKQFNGIDQNVSGSIDINYVNRSEDGRWLTLDAKNLGLHDHDVKASVEQQGDWAVNIGHNKLPKYAPFTVNTAVQGIGTDNLTLPTLPWGAGASFTTRELKTERETTSLFISKSLGFLAKGLQANLSLKSEDKQGVRMSGSGGNSFMSGGRSYSSQFFTPEPIDANHKQIEASLDYYSKKFQVSAGYYGSFYKNNMGPGLLVGPTSTFGRTPDTPTGTTRTTLSTNQSALSLAPDNHAQEIYLTGGYNFSDDTRVTFKGGKTFAVQDDNFIPSFQLTPSTSSACGPTQLCPAILVAEGNLGGKVETTNLATSFTSKINKELSVLASLAYEDRQDKTPIRAYIRNYSTGSYYFNNPESMSNTRGKVEGTYKLPYGYRVTAGYDYDQKHYKGMEEEGLRDKMAENTYRIDLRKNLSDTLNGNIQLAHSERNGSAWGSNPDAFGGHWVAPSQFADRNRDKVKMLVEWVPLEELNLQFGYETAWDNYSSRANNMGLDKGSSKLYSIDATYQLNDNWKVTGWYSLSNNKILQNSRQNPRLVDSSSNNIQNCDGTAANRTCNPWSANLALKNEAIGAGIQGKVIGKVEIGAQYLYSHDVNKYNVNVSPVSAGNNNNSPVLAGAGVLPDTVYSMNSLRVFGKYPISKSTTLRLDYVYDVRKMDDYTWNSWSFSDGTTVYAKPKQSSYLIGLTLIQSF